MIVHDVQQNTPEWLQLRLGIPTASEFKRIVTPTGKLSSQADEYMERLIAEWVTGCPLDSVQTEYMERGHDLEQQAADAVEFAEGIETYQVGFITTDDGRIGCSPDRFVKGRNIGVELKVPAGNTQVGYLLRRAVDEKHKPQVQGGLYVTGYDEWIIGAYCPEFPTAIIRARRDEEYIAKLDAALREFCDRMDAAKEQLRKRYGVVPKCERTVAAPELDRFGFDVTDEDVHQIFKRSK